MQNARRTIDTDRLGMALGAFAMGAGAMFLLDPDRGRRRRTLIGHKLIHASHVAADASRKTAEYVRGRCRGLLHETRRHFRDEAVPDAKLVARVRSAIGRACSHPRAIQVGACDGCVVVCGPVLTEEADQLIHAVSRVPGVRAVEDRLEPHPHRDIPALQGGSQRTGRRYAVLQDAWPPHMRLLMGGGGTIVGGLGLRLGGFWGGLCTVGGLGMLLRAASNLPARRLVGIGAGRRAVTVQKTITIDAPVDAVFKFFSNYANFPRFMRNVYNVRDHGDGRSHWTVAGPMGTQVGWGAILTDYQPNERIAWRSVEGAAVANAGVIRFDPAGPDATRVDIKLSYNPPAGAIGHALARVFGADAKSEMDDDLLRAKTMIETGHPAHDAAQAVH